MLRGEAEARSQKDTDRQMEILITKVTIQIHAMTLKSEGVFESFCGMLIAKPKVLRLKSGPTIEEE